MFVLKSSGIEPMLIGRLDNYNNGGIYREVREENILEKDKIEILRGSAVVTGKYVRSNTGDITYKKYFEKISEPLDFEAIKENIFKELNKDETELSLNSLYNVLDKTENNSLYKIQFYTPYESANVDLILTRTLANDEIKVKDECRFKEYEYSFKEMYSFYVKIMFCNIEKEVMNELFHVYKKNKMFISLNEFKEIVSKYSLAKNKLITSYSKENNYNFTGKHAENINVYDKSNINNIMSFTEATIKWGLADSTLRKLVKTDKLTEGIDYRKSGKVWLISKEAMIKIYGEPTI